MPTGQAMLRWCVRLPARNVVWRLPMVGHRGVRIRIAWVWRRSTNALKIWFAPRSRSVAILDNFCWPGCDDEVRMGELVRASLACYDGATAYGAPFISGKDSLNNQFRTEEGDVIRIPPTLLISGFAPVEAERFVTSMDAKSAGNVLMLVGVTTADLGGAHVTELAGGILPGGSGKFLCSTSRLALPMPKRSPGPFAQVVCSAHDLSEGGLLVAAEMGFAGRLGIERSCCGPRRCSASHDCICEHHLSISSRYLEHGCCGCGLG